MKRWQGWAVWYEVMGRWKRDSFTGPDLTDYAQAETWRNSSLRDSTGAIDIPVTLLPTAELEALEAKAAAWDAYEKAKLMIGEPVKDARP